METSFVASSLPCLSAAPKPMVAGIASCAPDGQLPSVGMRPPPGLPVPAAAAVMGRGRTRRRRWLRRQQLTRLRAARRHQQDEYCQSVPQAPPEMLQHEASKAMESVPASPHVARDACGDGKTSDEGSQSGNFLCYYRQKGRRSKAVETTAAQLVESSAQTAKTDEEKSTQTCAITFANPMDFVYDVGMEILEEGMFIEGKGLKEECYDRVDEAMEGWADHFGLQQHEVIAVQKRNGRLDFCAVKEA